MKRSAHIEITGDTVKVRFDWVVFDGDDCFEDFFITITTDGETRRFDFGPCAISGLRKLVRFFGDPAQETVSGGFRHPDIRYYDLLRSAEGYRLVVRYEGSGLHEELHIHHPTVDIAGEYFQAYDA